MNKDTLQNLKKDTEATITGINDCCRNKLRLLDMGFTKGSVITPLCQSKNKHITAYRIKGTVVALRTEESRCINIIL